MSKINQKKHIGKKFGNLTVIGVKYINQAKGPTFHWICRCNCGKTVNVRNSILNKRVGCHNCSIILKRRIKNKSLKNHGGIKRRLLNGYIKRCRANNVEFNLSLDDFIQILTGNCHYCGAEPISSGSGYTRGNCVDGEFKKNTIDRVDSSKGYVKGNVVSCCLMCNKAKLDHPLDRFLQWVNKIYKHQRLKRSSTIPKGSTLK